jgi:hypothetical protein
MVAISLTQLRALSVEFGFDYQRAKEFLNINTDNLGRPQKVGGNVSPSLANTKAYDGKIIPSSTELKKLMKSEKSEKRTDSSSARGRTGYHYYMAEISEKVKKSVQDKARISGEKVPRNAVVSEVSLKWHALSDSKKEAWNNYAKHQNQKKQ